MRLGLVLLVGLGGCDFVFHLDTVPTPVPAALDEDGDGVPNTDDDCPGTADPDQADGDGDHVGDACDPHPAVGGDGIVSAAYFNTDLDGWSPASASDWVIADGAASNSVETQLSKGSLNPAGTFPTIELGYTDTTFVSGMSNVRLTLSDGSASVTCHVDFNQTDFSLFLAGSTGSALTSSPVQRLVLQLDGTGSTCSVQGQPITSATTLPAGPTTATLQVQFMLQLGLRYIVVYQSP